MITKSPPACPAPGQPLASTDFLSLNSVPAGRWNHRAGSSWHWLLSLLSLMFSGPLGSSLCGNLLPGSAASQSTACTDGVQDTPPQRQPRGVWVFEAEGLEKGQGGQDSLPSGWAGHGPWCEVRPLQARGRTCLQTQSHRMALEGTGCVKFPPGPHTDLIASVPSRLSRTFHPSLKQHKSCSSRWAAGVLSTSASQTPELPSPTPSLASLHPPCPGEPCASLRALGGPC